MNPNRHQVVCFDQAIEAGTQERLTARLLESMGQHPISALFCNVHMLMLAQQDQSLATAMKSADLVLPDGVPIAWLQRRLGFKDAAVLRGETALDLVCRTAATEGRSIGFLGSTPKVLSSLRVNLTRHFPSLLVDYLYAPPDYGTDIEVETELVAEINSRNLFCLFIGLGCPKQEKWVDRYAPHLNCSLLAIGAVFDWTAGTVTPPPIWMVRSGMAWLYRLVQSPRRMWYRYFMYNSRFVLMVSRLLLFGTPLQAQRGPKID